MNKYQEALDTIGMTKTNNIKSESLSKPRVMYLVKELRKKEIQTIKQYLERLEKLEKDLKYISEQDFQIYRFPNGRIIFGVDITNCPSEQEKVKRILEEVLENENFL